MRVNLPSSPPRVSRACLLRALSGNTVARHASQPQATEIGRLGALPAPGVFSRGEANRQLVSKTLTSPPRPIWTSRPRHQPPLPPSSPPWGPPSRYARSTDSRAPSPPQQAPPPASALRRWFWLPHQCKALLYPHPLTPFDFLILVKFLRSYW